MSLFKARECWITQCSIDENFDVGNLLVATLNSDNDYIIIGSHSGVLRVYQPSLLRNNDEKLEGYKPTDLLIEKQLPCPILQICRGRLVSGNLSYQLALLHPRSVGVYSLLTKTGLAEHGHHTNAILTYEHQLNRAAAKMVVGGFGGTQSRDFIGVMSLDGILTFFEQEHFAFCCFLPDFLLPGPIAYVETKDIFVTFGSNWYLQSYRYKNLSEAGQNSQQSDMEGKRLEPDWIYNIGEEVLDIRAVKCTVTEYSIVVLAERCLYCLSEIGNLKFMKRFDYSPVCFYPYFLGAIDRILIMVISETNTLMIYDNTTLRWSAQLSLTPISIGRGFFTTVKGALVFLSDQGSLQVCYLGTQPILFNAPPIINKELDFENVEKELATLNKIIRIHKSNDVGIPNASAEQELIVTIYLNPHLKPCKFLNITNEDPDKEVKMCIVTVDLMPNAPFMETQISLSVQPPLKVEPNVHFINNLQDKEKVVSYVYQKEAKEISNTQLKVVVSYVNKFGVPKIITKVSNLPYKMVMVADAASKEAHHKITLHIDETAPPLANLFGEFIGEHGLCLASNAVGFANVMDSGTPVTILLAKSSSKYRIQSDSLASINLPMHELSTRLFRHFQGTDNFKVKHNSNIPTNVFFDVIEKHYNKSKKVIEIQTNINNLAAQFRLIQKRLLTKFKDRNPTPLKNLDKLILDTHNDVIQQTENLIKATDELHAVQCELSGIICLIIQLIKYGEVPEDLLKKIQSILLYPNGILEDQSWEDVTYVCVNYMLKAVLAKSDKYKNGANFLDKMPDINKLKKNISQIFDRLSHGNALVEIQATEEEEEDELVTAEETELLEQIGSKIAERSAKSAKTRAPIKIKQTEV